MFVPPPPGVLPPPLVCDGFGEEGFPEVGDCVDVGFGSGGRTAAFRSAACLRAFVAFGFVLLEPRSWRACGACGAGPAAIGSDVASSSAAAGDGVSGTSTHSRRFSVDAAESKVPAPSPPALAKTRPVAMTRAPAPAAATAGTR